ncbi:MAG: hypothetical protein MN733_03445 [Nitrososphaera sp.]|nr:hypothetical protein [Nitrososphaera sp.]
MLELSRVGILISRRGSWRETVMYYGAFKDMVAQCVARYDFLVSDGMDEAWAALRSLNEHGCADIILDKRAHKIDQIVGGLH